MKIAIDGAGVSRHCTPQASYTYGTYSYAPTRVIFNYFETSFSFFLLFQSQKSQLFFQKFCPASRNRHHFNSQQQQQLEKKRKKDKEREKEISILARNSNLDWFSDFLFSPHQREARAASQWSLINPVIVPSMCTYLYILTHIISGHIHDIHNAASIQLYRQLVISHNILLVLELHGPLTTAPA